MPGENVRQFLFDRTGHHQIRVQGLLERIGWENVFVVHQQWGISAYEAYESAQAWLDEVRPPAQGQEEEAETE